MTTDRPIAPPALEPAVQRALDDFVAAAVAAFGDALESLLLFGSAVEGRLRATSDVNVLLVLQRFDAAAADRLREPLRLAMAAIALHPMFVLRSELPEAMQAFALRFADIASRHRVLHGSDPFAGIELPRQALVQRLQQVLLNLQIRARERYVALSLREEQLWRHVADSAGPLRSAAAALLQLEGRPAADGKRALEALAADPPDAALAAALASMSAAREGQWPAPGGAAAVALQLMVLIERMRHRAGAL